MGVQDLRFSDRNYYVGIAKVLGLWHFLKAVTYIKLLNCPIH